MRSQRTGLGCWAAFLSVLSLSTISRAIPLFSGGNGAISFGVASYGNPQNNGAPTYIANNFTGNTDILSSPGGGTLGAYQTASPVVGNNIASYLFGLSGQFFQVGGSNGNGNFGSAAATAEPGAFRYSISDSAPGSGSASYLIDSEVATFTDAAGTAAGAHYGAWLTMGGNVNLVGSADVAALRVRISSPNGASPFFGGVDLPQMVLAISRNFANNNAGDYNVVTVGGSGAGLIVDNFGTGTFRALSVDNLLLGAAIPAGDTLTISATLTAYADPADISSFDLVGDDLLAITGPLPDISFVGAPEPTSLVSIGAGLLCLMRLPRKSQA
ncbi:MAG TPA: hypothetical protein VHD56_16670 [Tepidisphaeraceae bacterium]|nr:hypothetical protein [Tepidisphaeraceae bacterium]